MDEQREIVIGREMADARAADERRLAGGPPPSPLPTERYEDAHGEFGLLRIQPVLLDEALTGFVRRYRANSVDQRARMRDGIGVDEAYTLLAYARRASVFALRSGDASLVADGLGAAAAIPYERIDPRDGLVALALLHHAGRRCGHGAVALFEAAREVGERAFASLIDGFLARPASAQDLRSAWGYVEADGPFGVGLLSWGYGPWSPTVDLALTSLAIAEALRGDEYLIEDPMLGAELPSVWLSASADGGLEPTLERIRAGAIIHGRLRGDVGPGLGSQQLTAWVLEADSAEDVQLLERLARTPRAGDALLCLADGALFVLVVARSVVMGVAAHETTPRLRRFEAGIEATIGR